MQRITRGEIKRKLAKHYQGPTEEHLERRDLIELNHDEENCLDKGSCIIFFLSGTPPKGYAIYTPALRRVSLYDARGKRFRKITSTVLEGKE